jgi:lipopolysaccharide heptosyltransferase II
VADPASIVVVAPNWLGDAVMALPAIADVRRRFGQARLVVAARRSVAGLFAIVPGVDDVVDLEWRGRVMRLAAMTRDVARLRAVGAQLAILLPNSFAAAWLAHRAGIAERWGYAGDLRTSLLTTAIEKPRQSVHQGVYYQLLLQPLGVPSGPLEARVTVPAAARSEARRIIEGSGWDGVSPIVVLAPGAAYGTAKRWLPEHFARVVDMLSADPGTHSVLIGSDVDNAAAAMVVDRLPAPARARVSNLCGQTTLAVLAGVLDLARACVSNDSGAMHLAAAVGVPLAAIFGPTNEHETAPLARAGVDTRLLIHPVPCRPCMLRECPIDHPCMRDLDPERVLSTVRLMIANHGLRPDSERAR